MKIYDGCSGGYIQDMEDKGWLAGPQAIVEDGNGGLLVVSEENDRLIRFDRETLVAERVISGDDPETAEVEAALFDAPTGLAVSPEGRVFVGSFTRDRVLEIDPDTGAFVQVMVAANQGVEGCRCWYVDPGQPVIRSGIRFKHPGRCQHQPDAQSTGACSGWQQWTECSAHHHCR